ncbi:MAG: RNA polymerase sigma factor [Cyclobacteriaceae bacterium]
MAAKAISDLELIDQVLSGEVMAYRTLTDKYKDYAYTLALRVLGNKEEAEEAAQDAFVKAFNSLKSFNRTAKFTTWFYRIVLNTAISYKRRQKPPMDSLEQRQVIGDGEISQMDQFKILEQRKYLQNAMNYLKADDVSVLTLFYFKEHSLEEMSEITGIAVNTLKVKLYRARKRLGEVLGKILKKEVSSLL